MKGNIFSTVALVSVVATMFSGCAIMSEDECRSTNWYDKGYSDGVNGTGSAVLREYIDACEKYVHVDTAGYNSGRRSGADVYCTDDRGYEMGMSNSSVSDICKVSSNVRSFSSYYNRGKAVYNECSYLYRLDDTVSAIDKYAGDRRLGYLSRMLYRDRDYLAEYRSELSDYCEYVKANGRSGNFTTQDYSNVFRHMPYPNALANAEAAYDMIEKSDEAMRRVERKIDDKNRCLDDYDSDTSTYRRCYKELQCYERAYGDLRRNQDYYLRRYESDAKVTGVSTSWINEYNRCE